MRHASKNKKKKNEKNSFLVDPKMTNKLGGNIHDHYIKELSSNPGIRVLDISFDSGFERIMIKKRTH